MGCTIEQNIQSTDSVQPSPTPYTDNYAWWTSKVGYQIFVRSFYDSDGDGMGDFNGITQKLDYLNDGDPATTTDLGVSIIWLMPIFPSPSYHGYDVTNYYAVNPQYGTMEDFKLLLNEAHKRGIKVIIDLVLNHTSAQHPWFVDAESDTNSPYRDWYIWSETNPGYKGPDDQIVWHSSKTGFYYGLFSPSMPDLNYTNSEVTTEMEKISSFWLQDIGVDGFRLDAVKHLIENNRLQQNTRATHEWLKGFHNSYKSINPYAITLGELYGDNVTSVNSYTEGDELDLAFNFELATAFVKSADLGSALTASRALSNTDKMLEPEQYSPFLTNHDQNRSLSEFEGDQGKAKVAASLLLTSPGMPFLYYGEEIGMEGEKPDENIRRPMQWSSKANGGFTSGTPWELLGQNYASMNVEAESSSPDSLLSHYRNLIHIRNAHSALQTGEWDLINSRDNKLLASLRSNDEEAVIILINTSDVLVDEYELSIDKSSLVSGEFTISTLLGSPIASNLSVGPLGDFKGYKPLDEIPPFSTTLLLLQTSSKEHNP